MNSYFTFFLRLAPLPLFLLLFAPGLVAFAFIFGLLRFELLEDFTWYATTLLTSFAIAMQISWQLAVATLLDTKYTDDASKPDIKMFKAVIAITIAKDIWDLELPALLGLMKPNYQESISSTMIDLVLGVYVCYFLARSLVAAEKKPSATFGDYVGEFFSFLFAIVGVFWLQPRITALFNDNDNNRWPQPGAPLDQL